MAQAKSAAVCLVAVIKGCSLLSATISDGVVAFETACTAVSVHLCMVFALVCRILFLWHCVGRYRWNWRAPRGARGGFTMGLRIRAPLSSTPLIAPSWKRRLNVRMHDAHSTIHMSTMHAYIHSNTYHQFRFLRQTRGSWRGLGIMTETASELASAAGLDVISNTG